MVQVIGATEARKEFSRLTDAAVRERPQFVSRTRDKVAIINLEDLKQLLLEAPLPVEYEQDEDGSFVFSAEGVPVVETGRTFEEGKANFIHGLVEFSEEVYSDLAYYRTAPNIKKLLPLVYTVICTVLTGPEEEVGALLQCQAGKN